jgi:uncharacterized protein YndB with AHSA1/START domain
MRSLIAPLLLATAVPAAAQDVTVRVDTLTDGTRTMTHEAVIPAGPTKVWAAVATAKGWRTWAVPLVREGAGGRFETSYDPSSPAGAPNTIEQQWIVRKAPRSASFRTTRTPKGFPHAAAYLQVVSTFTLMPEGPATTRVTLATAGYPPGAAGDALIAFFRSGNSIGLDQLKARFIGGPIDWKAALQKEK